MNSKIKLSNNSSFVIFIFVILNSKILVVLHSVVPNFDPHPISQTWTLNMSSYIKYPLCMWK